jgi:predicted ferric reductase
VEVGVVEKGSADFDYEQMETGLPFSAIAGMLLAVLAGVFLAVVAVPRWAPELAATLFGTAPKAYWYLSRSSAFAAYGLLWASMAVGIMISNKMARMWPGGPTAFDIHQFTGLLGLNIGLFHALILLGDRFIDYRLAQILLPFGSVNYRPTAVGLGQVGFYALIVVSLTFYVRRWIGHRLWRVVHYVSFAAFLLTMVHGLLAGTDSGSALAILAYAASGISLLFLSIYRVLMVLFPARRRARAR